MREVCIALDCERANGLEFSSRSDGLQIRRRKLGAPDNNGGDGPRSTPSVMDGKVWAMTRI